MLVVNVPKVQLPRIIVNLMDLIIRRRDGMWYGIGNTNAFLASKEEKATLVEVECKGRGKLK